MAKSLRDATGLYIGKRPKRFRVWKLFLYLAIASVMGLMGLLGAVYYEVSSEASSRIQEGAIRRVIFSESPVYYDDGKTPIGVFFEKTHRQYIDYREIPKTFVKAIVAAEDKNFFDHPGFDVSAIVRAFVANLKAGRIVQGGSTITQQTAKNVFKRQRRSYTAKLKELFQALLLERKYSKEQILEFYANQFFVSGFGRGLQIASRYFFDKDAGDLDLVESAFIAGCVKGPNRYNPFIKKTEAEREQALREAKLRKDYVLEQMLELNFVTREEYEEAREKEVPFKEGRVTYRLNVILDYVRDQLQSPYFRTILEEEGIENIATSGIRIHTSINRELQQGTLESLRAHLPALDVKLQGYDTRALQERYERLKENPSDLSGEGLPIIARVSGIHADSDEPYLDVSWKGGGGAIDFQGMEDMGEAWVQSRKGVWESFNKSDVPDFLELFSRGDMVAVIRDGDGPDLRLTQIPELDGGAVVLQGGMIRAMAGGYFNRFFNRAVDAKRQMGSIFKPIVYTAALQLKWNPLDTLRNVRDLFSFEKTYYLPKPDHEPESEDVSMAWAGVKSENLATVWLLYHLTDHLNLSEFREVVQRIGLHRRSNESYRDYVQRIRDKHGVLVDEDALMEAAFTEAKKEIESDVIFAGHDAALDNLRRLHYRVERDALDMEDAAHRRILRLNYQRLKDLNVELEETLERLGTLLDRVSPGSDQSGRGYGELATLLGRFVVEDYPDRRGRRLVFPFTSAGASGEVSRSPLAVEEVLDDPGLLDPDGIWVAGVLPSEVLDILRDRMVITFKDLVSQQRYDLELLYRIRDFRTLVNLHYLRELARNMGVSTPLDPVLSFPLGANAVSIAEMARAYHTMMCGRMWPLGRTLSDQMIPVIKRIEDRQGQVIWDYEPRTGALLSPKVSGMVSEILRLVVERGTGKRAHGEVRLSVPTGEGSETELPIPAFGKTGTANRYTNSGFVGFVPGPGGEASALDRDNGYVIACYVGFDDNRPMKGDRVTIYGSSGALPIWIDTANEVVNSPDYREGLRLADLAFDLKPGLVQRPQGLHPVEVDAVTGLLVRRKEERAPGGTAFILSDVDVEDGTVRLNRLFEPIQGVIEHAQD